jgi:hypothetical protein
LKREWGEGAQRGVPECRQEVVLDDAVVAFSRALCEERQHGGAVHVLDVTYVRNGVADPIFSSPWLSGRSFSAASLRTSRSGMVAGASFSRFRLRWRSPLTNTSAHVNKYHQFPSRMGLGSWKGRRANRSRPPGSGNPGIAGNKTLLQCLEKVSSLKRTPGLGYQHVYDACGGRGKKMYMAGR